MTSVSKSRPGPKPRPVRERLLSKAVINFETGCWEWTGAKASGYGRIKVDGRCERSHRVAYELIEGPIPIGLELDHLCRNTGCINPAHLEPVTGRENNHRSNSPTAINARKSRCNAGHDFTAENTLFRPGKGRECRTCRIAARKLRYEADRKRALAHRQAAEAGRLEDVA